MSVQAHYKLSEVYKKRSQTEGYQHYAASELSHGITKSKQMFVQNNSNLNLKLAKLPLKTFLFLHHRMQKLLINSSSLSKDQSPNATEVNFS